MKWKENFTDIVSQPTSIIISLFYYEKPLQPMSVILTYITKSFFVLLLFFSLSVFTRHFLIYGVWKYQICKYLLREKSEEGKEIYLLLSPTFLVFVGISRSSEKTSGKFIQCLLEKWQISSEDFANIQELTEKCISFNAEISLKFKCLYENQQFLWTDASLYLVAFCVYCFNFHHDEIYVFFSWNSRCQSEFLRPHIYS